MDQYEECFSISQKKEDRESKRIRDATKLKSKQERLDKWRGRKGKWEKLSNAKSNGIKRSGSGKNLANLVMKDLTPPQESVGALPKFLLPENDAAFPSKELICPSTSSIDSSKAFVSPARTVDGKELSTDYKVSLAALFRASVDMGKASADMAERLGKDEIVQAIFHALFKRLRKDCNGEMKEYLGADDDEETEDDDLADVNEPTMKSFLSITVFSDEYNGSSTIPTGQVLGAETVLNQYLDSKLVHQLVQELRFEDDRVPSNRLSVVKAVYRAVPSRRKAVLVGLVMAAHDRLHRCREVEASAHALSLDVDAVLAGEVGKGAVNQGGSAQPAAARDQAMSLIELLDFVIGSLASQMKEYHLSAAQSQLEVPAAGEEEVWEVEDQVAAVVRALLPLVKCHATAIGESGEGELCALQQCVAKLAKAFPCQASRLAGSLSASWPVGNALREVAFVRLLETIVSNTPSLLLLQQSRAPVAARIFSRVEKCISSLHFKVAQAAVSFFNNEYIVSQYLLLYPGMLKAVSNALHSNKSHWNLIVRQQSEQVFDFLLDFM